MATPTQEFPSLSATTLTLNKQDISGNKESQDEDKLCRICLLTSHQRDPAIFLSPCACAGSLKYTHEHCLYKWLSIRVQNGFSSENGMKEIPCEICQTKISFTSEKVWCLAEFQDTKRVFKNFKNVIILGIVSTVCLILCSCYLLTFLWQGSQQYLKKKGYYNVILALIILTPVLFSVFIGFWGCKLFLRRKLKVKKIITPTGKKTID